MLVSESVLEKAQTTQLQEIQDILREERLQSQDLLFSQFETNG